MRYEGTLYRPPSEAHSYILQATIGCSHNLCTYCDMYRSKNFRVRPLEESLADLQMAHEMMGDEVEKIFVADGDALVLEMELWRAILTKARRLFPKLRRVSCYATAENVLAKSKAELQELAELGLTMLYIGPESGDPVTLKRIVKGATHEDHVEASQRAQAAGMQISMIVLLGAGGIERSEAHAKETARLITGMDPAFLSALTLTVLPNTPMQRMVEKQKFVLPSVAQMLGELRVVLAESEPTNAVFRTNHASNYLPLAGRLPQDKARLLASLDAALDGDVALRPEWMRAL